MEGDYTIKHTEIYKYSEKYHGIYKLCNDRKGHKYLHHLYIDARHMQEITMDYSCEDKSSEEAQHDIINILLDRSDDMDWVDVCGSAFSNLPYGDKVEDTISEWSEFVDEIHCLFKEDLVACHISYTMPISFVEYIEEDINAINEAKS